MKLQLKEDPREWRKFMLSALSGQAVLSLLLAWRRVIGGQGLAVWLGALAVLAVVCWRRPHWFRGVYRVGLTVGFRVGQGLGWVFLTVFFFVVVTPLGWILRLLGNDPLRLKRDVAATSYWQPPRKRSDLERMF